jgi:hypothetical protein
MYENAKRREIVQKRTKSEWQKDMCLKDIHLDKNTEIQIDKNTEIQIDKNTEI